MMPGPERELFWRKSLMGLVVAQEKGRLPLPIALHTYPEDGTLHVQVEEDGYRAWLDAIHAPVVESYEYEGDVHVVASGPLVNCRMVNVRCVAVMHRKEAVAQ